MTTTLITPAEKANLTVACVYNAAEAAAKLGVAETTIRRECRKAGVKKIAGRTVAGFVRFTSQPVDVVLPFSERA
jgi:DeoR/GlpR family transcriptional regulator of sugar metabolism